MLWGNQKTNHKIHSMQSIIVRRRNLNKNLIRIMAMVITALIVITFGLFAPALEPHSTQQELDFSVAGTNSCLRFLEPNVGLCYVPFTTGPNEKWNLTINCLEMPGSNGWTDIYVYSGYWNKGTDNKCLSQDLYPIISDIHSTDFRVINNNTFTEIFGGKSTQAQTMFFVLPVGGQSAFHITLNRIT
jgi:hypothetical protein